MTRGWVDNVDDSGVGVLGSNPNDDHIFALVSFWKPEIGWNNGI